MSAMSRSRLGVVPFLLEKRLPTIRPRALAHKQAAAFADRRQVRKTRPFAFQSDSIQIIQRLDILMTAAWTHRLEAGLLRSPNKIFPGAFPSLRPGNNADILSVRCLMQLR